MKKFLSLLLILAVIAGIVYYCDDGGDPPDDELGSLSNAKELSLTVEGVSFIMVKVDGGTFMMGATSEQGNDAYDDEKPAHQVTLSDYYIGQTEVTQALWLAVMGNNPSYFGFGDKTLNCPVERLSWDDCQAFIAKLNQLTGRKFRLPTEAEWEYAARGGKKSKGYKYAGSNNYSEVAWCAPQDVRTKAVASKAPNELGLYDMSGNVREWVQDKFGSYSNVPQKDPTGLVVTSQNYRLCRGGSWYDVPRYCRVSKRIINDNPAYSSYTNGIRLALSFN